jgi:hypothetical protein
MDDWNSQRPRRLAVRLIIAGVTGVLLSGCQAPSRLVGPGGNMSTDLPGGRATFSTASAGMLPRASGGGYIHLATLDLDIQFAFTAVQQSTSGAAVGAYHFASPDGFELNIDGRITCMTADPQHPGRAWMGGEITRNESVLPNFTGENSKVGRDGWFRVVDYGEGAGAPQPDRTTSIFFEPAGGFSTAEEFCNGQLWFPDDRLTNQLLVGNIEVIHSGE